MLYELISNKFLKFGRENVGEEIIITYYSSHCSENHSKICYQKHELIREYFAIIMSD